MHKDVISLLKKIGLGIFLIVLFMGSTQAVSTSTYASDQLALIPGSYSSGITVIDYSSMVYCGEMYIFEYETTFKVLEILDYPDISDKLVRFGVSHTILSIPYRESVVGIVYDYDHFVWYHNRSIAIPLSYIKITNGTTVVEASLMDEVTFAGVSNLNNMVVTLSDGREFLWEDFLMVSSLEYEALNLRDYVMDCWSTESYLKWKEDCAISPESSIGQLIDYGWFHGEVVNTFTLIIGGETHEVLKVHIDSQESISETEYLYEAKTGLLVNFTQFIGMGIPFHYYIANDLHIAEPDDSGNTLTIPYDSLFSILGLGFMVSLVLIHKKKK